MPKQKLISPRTISAIAFTLTAVLLTIAPFAVSAGLSTFTPFQGTAQGNGNNLVSVLRGVVNFLLTLAAVIAAIFIVIGGFRYIFSQGDEENTNRAKLTVFYALMGLIVIAISGVLVNFIIANIPNPV